MKSAFLTGAFDKNEMSLSYKWGLWIEKYWVSCMSEEYELTTWATTTLRIKPTAMVRLFVLKLTATTRLFMKLKSTTMVGLFMKFNLTLMVHLICEI